MTLQAHGDTHTVHARVRTHTHTHTHAQSTLHYHAHSVICLAIFELCVRRVRNDGGTSITGWAAFAGFRMSRAHPHYTIHLPVSLEDFF